MSAILFILSIVGLLAVLFVADIGIEKFFRLFIPARPDMAPYKTPSHQQQPDFYPY